MPSPAASPSPDPAAPGELSLDDADEAWWAGSEKLADPEGRQETGPELHQGFGATDAVDQPAASAADPPPAEPAPGDSGPDLPVWGAADAAGTRAAVPPSVRAGRRVREGSPTPISPARALAGGGVAVAGVALGIAAVFYLTDGSHDSTSGAQAAGSVTTPTVPASGPPVPAASTAAPTAPTAPTPTPAPPVPSAAVILPPAAANPPATRPPLTVLNNSRVNGLADRMAATFAKDGWSVGTVGNFTGRVSSTTVYYEPGQEAAAHELAKAYGLPRVLPRFDGLPGSGLTVVLTRDAA